MDGALHVYLQQVDQILYMQHVIVIAIKQNRLRNISLRLNGSFGTLKTPLTWDSGGDKLVSWSSKKQDCTSMSSAEAEYVSLSACCAQVLWLRTQLTDYGFHFDKIPMYYDSKATIAISCNPVQLSYQAQRSQISLHKEQFKRAETGSNTNRSKSTDEVDIEDNIMDPMIAMHNPSPAIQVQSVLQPPITKTKSAQIESKYPRRNQRASWEAHRLGYKLLRAYSLAKKLGPLYLIVPFQGLLAVCRNPFASTTIGDRESYPYFRELTPNPSHDEPLNQFAVEDKLRDLNAKGIRGIIEDSPSMTPKVLANDPRELLKPIKAIAYAVKMYSSTSERHLRSR
ncbi:hypothetical protein Tco_0024034 [Tanacetum coccineum]